MEQKPRAPSRDDSRRRPAGSPARPTDHRTLAKRLAWGKARSPPRGPQYSDRFIPCRQGPDGSPSRVRIDGRAGPLTPATGATHDSRDEAGRLTYDLLLKNELLGARVDDMKAASAERRSQPATTRSTPTPNVFRFKQAAGGAAGLGEAQSPFSLSPIGMESQRLLQSPRKSPRKIPKVPFKVLDAPDLKDDFYLNLLDWSSQNVLCVGLGSCVYLWSACTSQVTKLSDLREGPAEQANDSVTAVSFDQRGKHLAVGTGAGLVQIWDVQSCKLVRTMEGHDNRAGALAWNAHTLSSGSRDRTILQRDVRVPVPFVKKLTGHKQEVCGLQWSPDEQHLASGGNDNKLFVWRAQCGAPVHRFTNHTAAVKALAWSPHQHGLLASGGGTADQTIRFWNTLSGQMLQCVNTKSQVCNLAWSKGSNEIVSTHGYSQNQVHVWKYPSMSQIATLTGHTLRVLYLAVSPDGQTIATGAGDETLRFWNVFSKAQSQKAPQSVLTGFSHIR